MDDSFFIFDCLDRWGLDEIVFWCDSFKDELEVIEKRLSEEESAKARKQLGID